MIDQGTKAIADYYGVKHQMRKLAEECAELVVEICKLQNDESKGENLVEEMADVHLMMDQLVYLLHCETNINRWKRYKIERQLKRISDAEHLGKAVEDE